MIKAIIFDKDGTLIQFHEFWISVAEKVLYDIINKYKIHKNISKKIFPAIGIQGNKLIPDGIFAAKTSFDLAKTWFEILQIPDLTLNEFFSIITTLFEKYSHQQKNNIRLFPGIKNVIIKLKDMHYTLAVITNDNLASTLQTLELTGIKPYIDFLGTDNGEIPAKPNPGWGKKFCDEFDLTPGQVIMVGDTPIDMQFGKNCGFYTIGVLNGVSDNENLQPDADEIIPSATDIFQTEILQLENTRPARQTN